ncbi:MAG: toxin-antitoxin system protein [Bacteroidales bacterium]|nr:toxin-antitoxin system protein [Bacteroidales bacterium]
MLNAKCVIGQISLFRFRTDIIERLKRNAIRENRTLNNYVESVLLDIVYDKPNDATKSAIKEAQSGKNPNKVYGNVDEMLKDS